MRNLDTPPSGKADWNVKTLDSTRFETVTPTISSYTPTPKQPKTVISHRQRKNLISGAEEFKQRTLEPRVGVAAALGVAGRPWESGGGGGGLRNESV